MSLRQEIKEAIVRDGKYKPVKVWDVTLGDPDLRDGTQTMTIQVTVLKPRKKRPKRRFL